MIDLRDTDDFYNGGFKKAAEQLITCLYSLVLSKDKGCLVNLSMLHSLILDVPLIQLTVFSCFTN